MNYTWRKVEQVHLQSKLPPKDVYVSVLYNKITDEQGNTENCSYSYVTNDYVEILEVYYKFEQNKINVEMVLIDHKLISKVVIPN